MSAEREYVSDLQIYDGRRLLGRIAEVNGSWRAWRHDGILLGVFPTKAAARAAVMLAATSGQVLP